MKVSSAKKTSLKNWQKGFGILTIAFILLVIAISTAHAGGCCDVVKDGLVACYSFDGNANDASGNGNHGTVNGAILTTDKFGNQNSAYKFDGMNNDIRIPDKPSQQISANRISISAWITLEKDIPNTQWRVVNKQQFWGAAWGLELFGNGYGYPSGYGSLYPGGYGYSVGQGNNLNFHNSDGSTYVNCTVSEVSLIPGTTYHVAVAAENNVAKIYIDGNLIKTCQNMLGIPSAINSDIVIGSLSESSDFFFNGIIDDVRIYNRAISEAEIRQLYSSISTITASAGTGGTISPSGSVSVNC